jgi:endonuclease/exonuclease/phosphatase family metal-dependent hydrolase
MRTNIRIETILLTCVALAACDADDGGGPAANDTTVADAGGDAGGDTGGDSTEAAPTTFVTYNAGLVSGFVPYADERSPKVVEALAGVDADVVCLQEVWDLDDIDAVISGVATVFPHEYHVITDAGDDGTTEPACTPAEATPLKDCVEANCAGTDDLAGCAIGNCGPQFGATSKACQECLAANIGSNDVDVIFTACAEGSSKFTSEGRNGLILLSKHPLERTSHVVMDSFLVRRAVLHAGVTFGGATHEVFCTHLTAGLSQIEYGGDFETWEGEQLHQVDQMADFIDNETEDGARVVLLGDMNAGPAVGTTISAETAAVYDKIVGLGFEAPYVLNEPPMCTWCSANSLVDDTSNDTIIDHVFMRGFGSPATVAERLLDGTVSITVNGAAVETNLSDHYGVRVEIQP